MATPVIMPRQGQSVESCIIGKWYKQVGDTVSVGEDLFSYETDKATFDEAAKVDGQVLAIFFAEDDDVPCLTNVCVIGAPGEDTAAFDPRGGESSAAAAAASAPEAAAVQAAAPAGAAAAAGDAGAIPAIDLAGLAISPRAKGLSKKHHVDLRTVAPTGPKGRVIERDVRTLIDAGRFATGALGSAPESGYPAGLAGTGIGGRVSVADLTPAAPAAAALTSAPAPSSASFAATTVEEKHTNIRKLIAKSMTSSLSTMAQLTYNSSFDATDVLDFRARLKKAQASGLAEKIGLTANITLNDIFLYTVSRVVKAHRACNAHYHDDKMVYFGHVNLGMAVDTPRGLMVPTIFNADQLSIGEISAQAKAKSAACQSGTISPDELKDGTITITNLGSLGIESFTPVINPPQTCILGVDCLSTAVKDVGGVAVPYQRMGLSLTADHRIIDGAPAARFLQDLKNALENFSILLMK
jgi:pyruvate dehydrogenase E2 component (dihydrolipoamide acetyltransferase)